MTIAERIKRALSDKDITERSDYKMLSEFYEEMKREGVVLKRSYDLPQLDTIGRGAYQEINNRSSEIQRRAE